MIYRIYNYNKVLLNYCVANNIFTFFYIKEFAWHQLRSWLNHGCGTICKDKNLTTVYLRADGQNDTLHYLWDFDGNPSVLLALTSHSASMNISWEDFLLKKKNSITFTEEPMYTFGVVFNKVSVYDIIILLY